jgi:hypothetical protein
LSDCTAIVATHLAYPKSAENNIGEEGVKAVREAEKAHNIHLHPGMEELRIGNFRY